MYTRPFTLIKRAQTKKLWMVLRDHFSPILYYEHTYTTATNRINPVMIFMSTEICIIMKT